MKTNENAYQADEVSKVHPAIKAKEMLEKVGESTTDIDFNDCEINVVVAELLRSVLKDYPNVSGLTFTNSFIERKVVYNLMQIPDTVNKLGFVDCVTDDLEKGFIPFASLPSRKNSITQFTYSGHAIGDLENFFNKLNDTSITQLNLDNTNLGDLGTEYLSHALNNNRSITKLSLCDNNITDGAKFLLEMLKTNTLLTELNLNGNSIPEVYKQEIEGILGARHKEDHHEGVKVSGADNPVNTVDDI